MKGLGAGQTRHDNMADYGGQTTEQRGEAVHRLAAALRLAAVIRRAEALMRRSKRSVLERPH